MPRHPESSRRVSPLLRAGSALPGVIALVCLLPACGSDSGNVPEFPLLPPGSPHLSSAPATSLGLPTATAVGAGHPGIGATQRVTAGGSTLVVTVERMIDPLGDSRARLLPGSHAVGVLLQIINRGRAIYDSSSTGDVALMSTAGPAPPLFAPGGVCRTALRDFDNYIYAGEVRSGCVVFDVAAGAAPTEVRFSPHGRAIGRVSWAAPG